MTKVDMSPEAVGARLRRVSELRDLCLYLGRAGKEHRRKLAATPVTPDDARSEVLTEKSAGSDKS